MTRSFTSMLYMAVIMAMYIGGKKDEIEAKLTKIINRQYKIEERLMLSAYIKRQGKINYIGSAVNDVREHVVCQMIDILIQTIQKENICQKKK